MKEINAADLLLEVHAAMVAEQAVTKKPSPWLGEVNRVFVAIAKEKGITEPPDKYSVMAHLLRTARSFRISEDYSEDFRTVWFNPTDVDRVHMERQERAKNTVLVTANIDKNQLHLFGEAQDGRQ